MVVSVPDDHSLTDQEKKSAPDDSRNLAGFSNCPVIIEQFLLEMQRHLAPKLRHFEKAVLTLFWIIEEKVVPLDEHESSVYQYVAWAMLLVHRSSDAENHILDTQLPFSIYIF